jgi:hypothetical protein
MEHMNEMTGSVELLLCLSQWGFYGDGGILVTEGVKG